MPYLTHKSQEIGCMPKFIIARRVNRDVIEYYRIKTKKTVRCNEIILKTVISG